MRLNDEIRYSADPAAVFSMLTDPAFQEKKCEATGAQSYSVEITPDGDEVTVTTHRTLPSDQVPDYLRTFVKQGVRLTQTDVWGPADDDGSRDGTISLMIAGAPVKLSGTLRLERARAGAVQKIASELKASVPIIGGRIEQAAETPVRAAIRKEEEISRDWLR